MHIFISKLTTAFRLPLQDWLILIKSWLILLYVRLRMLLTPFRSWKHWLTEQQDVTLRPLSENERSCIVTHRRMIALASKYHFVNANCLPKSLALKWMLAKQNIHSQLKMGLRQGSKQLEGHAWLQYDKTVLNDDHDVAMRYPVIQKINLKSLNL